MQYTSSHLHMIPQSGHIYTSPAEGGRVRMSK